MPRLQRKTHPSAMSVSDLEIPELLALMDGDDNAEGRRPVRWRGEAELRRVWLAVRDDVMARRPTNLPVEDWPIFERYG